MPESIESFVKKLQAEGVEAGKEAAEKIKNNARRKADKIIADAKNEAEQIIAKAKNEADKQLLRMQTELELAVRDSILKLRETIGNILSAMLIRKVEKNLSDADYLEKVIREVITAYARADAEKQPFMEINISGELSDKLNEGILKEFFQNMGEGQEKITMLSTLSKAGFEYKIDGATVEVSSESVSGLIAEMVGPRLQKILDNVIDNRSETAFRGFLEK
jgi:V/A-type H+-transporting ATPase subunit E